MTLSYFSCRQLRQGAAGNNARCLIKLSKRNYEKIAIYGARLLPCRERRSSLKVWLAFRKFKGFQTKRSNFYVCLTTSPSVLDSSNDTKTRFTLASSSQPNTSTISKQLKALFENPRQKATKLVSKNFSVRCRRTESFFIFFVSRERESTCWTKFAL